MTTAHHIPYDMLCDAFCVLLCADFQIIHCHWWCFLLYQLQHTEHCTSFSILWKIGMVQRANSLPSKECCFLFKRGIYISQVSISRFWTQITWLEFTPPPGKRSMLPIGIIFNGHTSNILHTKSLDPPFKKNAASNVLSLAWQSVSGPSSFMTPRPHRISAATTVFRIK